MKLNYVLPLLALLAIAYQNCAPVNKDRAPGSTLGSESLKLESIHAPEAMDQIRYTSTTEEGSLNSASQNFQIRIKEGSFEVWDNNFSQMKSRCFLSNETLSRLNKILSAGLCETPSLAPGTVACMAFTMPYAELFLENGDYYSLLPSKTICPQKGHVLCGTSNQELVDFLKLLRGCS